MPPIAGPLDTHLLLRAFVDELARCGVAHACTSPGSRSAPLALALSREERIRTWSHVDERSAGFFALGLAKTTGRAVVLACTSGTAAANYAPAVHEAREARVPLIVLTADRPPELRDTGAGQTIDQLDLFGRAATWFAELDLAEATPERARWARRMACRAVWTAEGPRPGVVHLNVPLREPLAPGVPAARRRRRARTRRRARRGSRAPPPRSRAHRSPSPPPGSSSPAPAPIPTPWPGPRAPAGRCSPTRSRACGADPTRSPTATCSLRCCPPRPPSCARGDLPTAKRLRQRLAGLEEAVQVVARPADGVAGPRWRGRPGPSRPDLRPAGRARFAADWLDRWRTADAAATAALEAELGDGLSEPAVARFLASRLGPDETLWVASSMPIRDVEAFAPLRDDGAAGGLQSRCQRHRRDDLQSRTARGPAATAPVTLLIGDVAVIHDAGGLLAHRRHGLDVRIVVIDNDGGGIFHFLPVAGEADAFTEHVATPHGTDFEALAAAAGVPYSRAERPGDLLAGGLVHVRTDREENLALHRRLSGGDGARGEASLVLALELVGDLADAFLDVAGALVDLALVLQGLVIGERARGFLDAALALVDCSVVLTHVGLSSS